MIDVIWVPSVESKSEPDLQKGSTVRLTRLILGIEY